MYKNGKLPSRMTYHILIKACLENPELEGLGVALRYHREMEKQDQTPEWYVVCDIVRTSAPGTLGSSGTDLEEWHESRTRRSAQHASGEVGEADRLRENTRTFISMYVVLLWVCTASKEEGLPQSDSKVTSICCVEMHNSCIYADVIWFGSHVVRVHNEQNAHGPYVSTHSQETPPRETLLKPLNLRINEEPGTASA